MITMRTSSIAAAAAAFSLLGAVPATALAQNGPPGDIPDNQAFVTFHGAGYSLKVPEGWQRTQKAARITFTDKYNSIRVEMFRSAKRPTVGSVETAELPRLRATVKGFSAPVVTRLSRPAGAAIVVGYRATSAPSAVTGKTITNDVQRFEFWRRGRLVVLTLQAPHGSDNVDPWRIVTNSFAWA